MQVQSQIQQINSLVPEQHLASYSSIEKRPEYKVIRGEFMIPFSTFSIKFSYVMVKIAFKIYVSVEISLVLMVCPPYIPLNSENNHGKILAKPNQPIPIASFSFNYIYCPRCNLGIQCSKHELPINHHQ